MTTKIPTYEIAYDEDQIRKAYADTDKDPIIAIERRGAARVGSGFALRPRYLPHPGAVGLYMLVFALDHILTGRSLMTGDEDQCLALVASLETMPIEWGTIVSFDPVDDAQAEFLIAATTRAQITESLDWVERSGVIQ